MEAEVGRGGPWTLSSEDNDMLEGRISDDLGKRRPPRQDGFPLLFFNKSWEFIKGDLLRVINEFQEAGFLNWRFNHTFVILIPKRRVPSVLGTLDSLVS